jgi:hypothetical protein
MVSEITSNGNPAGGSQRLDSTVQLKLVKFGNWQTLGGGNLGKHLR